MTEGEEHGCNFGVDPAYNGLREQLWASKIGRNLQGTARPFQGKTMGFVRVYGFLSVLKPSSTPLQADDRDDERIAGPSRLCAWGEDIWDGD